MQNAATVTEVKKEEVAGPPLPIQEVKEKWEYVKRRVKSKKDGAKIAALLNGYTIVGVEEQAGTPVVIIAAGALFHYTTLQQPTHYDTIQWALKTELKRDCKVRMLPPGQGGPGASIPLPPTPPSAINSTASRTTLAPQESQPHSPTYKEQLTSAPENVEADQNTGAANQHVGTANQNIGAADQDVGAAGQDVGAAGQDVGAAARPSPQPPHAPSLLTSQFQKTPTTSLLQEEPQAQSDQGKPASSATIAYDISSQSSPLARMTNVRENTNRVPTGDSRLLFAQKKAKNDQVVQEVVRLFKAEVKDIQLK
jgi:hypothetical protein